jgi:putative ABC transport system ATP-binding protein
VSARSLYRFFRAGDDETLALRGVSLEVGQGSSSS